MASKQPKTKAAGKKSSKSAKKKALASKKAAKKTPAKKTPARQAAPPKPEPTVEVFVLDPGNLRARQVADSLADLMDLQPTLEQASKRDVGRPELDFDFTTFERLCGIQCTLAEIACVLGVSEDTVERRCEQNYGLKFKEAFERFSAGGRESLRRAQFYAATVDRNPTLLIWLGKQYLGQKDESKIKHEFDKLSDQELIAAAAGLFSRDS